MILSALRIIVAGASFTCTPTAVWDGDGPIWCAEGPRIRLAGIAAREIDGTCRSNQPCPAASGPAARDGLVAMLGGPRGRGREGHVLVTAAPMRCQSMGSAGGSRTAAWCVTGDGRDLSCALVKAGFALRWPRYWRNHRCQERSPQGQSAGRPGGSAANSSGAGPAGRMPASCGEGLIGLRSANRGAAEYRSFRIGIVGGGAAARPATRAT